MFNTQKIDIGEFCNLYNGIVKSYSVQFNKNIAPLNELKNQIYNGKSSLTIQELLSITKSNNNKFIESFVKRLIGVNEIIYCREENVILDTKEVWSLISTSIRIIPNEYIISSIGSQGFLSIPLYKKDEPLEQFDFIRLHIWDDSLDKYMDLKKCQDFSIHSHTFFARSWILTGMVKNDRYEYKTDTSNNTHSFFEVQYNNSLNEVNQHTSKAVNKNIDIKLIRTSQEVHFSKGYYEIRPGKLHQSGHLNSPHTSATLFSFTGKEGLGDSFVIGPKQIRESAINRKMNINPNYLLDKIESQIL